ncbi:hypothetical protein GBA52_015194 [Prunus armeniaca]|nr:hypothetical protein GBA52_015194 [Prunus armeniaca]
MGKSKAPVLVVDVTDSNMELEFQQEQIITQLNDFHDTVALMSSRQHDLQTDLITIQTTLHDMTIHQPQQAHIQ